MGSYALWRLEVAILRAAQAGRLRDMERAVRVPGAGSEPVLGSLTLVGPVSDSLSSTAGM